MTDWIVTSGAPEPPGATADATGVNFAVFSAHAEAILVCLFDAADTEIASLSLPSRTGDVFHGHIAGLAPGALYGLRAYGRWDPAQGHRFNATKLLVDPYATEIDRPFRLCPGLCDTDGPQTVDTAPVVPKAIVQRPPEPMLAFEGGWRSDGSPAPPRQGDGEPLRLVPIRHHFDWDRQVIYELHVRGFTARHPDIPKVQQGTFAGLAHPAAVAHLKRLGVTTVELMPSAAWIDDRHLPAIDRSNYWGYNPVAFLAPDRRLAPGGWAEIRTAVAALQSSGIAVVLDVVLNHSGEGDHLGPTVSLRGLDNATYYRTKGDRYVNDAGCGNILALDRPPVVRLAMGALRTWALRAGLDGFRLDLATTLGRRPDGFDPAAPLLAAMQQDPVLSRCAIIAEPWDIGPGGYQLGAFPAAWGEWNDRFRDTARRFWRGDGGMLGELATRFAGSADVFAARHRPLSRSINFVTAHDGFTLADLVAYTAKRNDANNEHNHDGSTANYSWNNGVEGPTGDPAILAARARDVRALLATLLFSRGTPMLSMGDEAGRSQGGNNNPYTQDNETSWFDWQGLDAELTTFVAHLVQLRLNNPVLSNGRALTGRPIDDSLIPDVVWHLPDGRQLSPEDWERGDNRSLIVALYADGQRLIVVLHAGDAAIKVDVPAPRLAHHWACAIDSAAPERRGAIDDPFHVAPRSVVLLTEDAGETTRRRIGVASEQLDHLARTAGIASVWWDIDGGEHRVGDDTKQTLLTAMRLPAGTPADLADSLARLEMREMQPLPPVLVVREGAAIRLPLATPAPGAWLLIRHDDGAMDRNPVSADSRCIALAPLRVGRHRVWFDTKADAVCHLIVVPARCYLPAEFAAGQRRFGLAAQLYALRRPGDQGIGDFTTLALLVEESASCGAVAVGLNPLHALFPGDRERASPYYPSDRRFLDPIYIDVSGLPGAAGLTASDQIMIDYPRVWAGKQQVLRASFDAAPGDDPAFEAFLAQGGDALRRFATFEAIAADHGNTPWRLWPDALRHPLSGGVAEFAREHAGDLRFSCWLQYRAHQQLGAAARQAALPIGLYRDLAVGAAPDGAESWGEQDMLLSGVSIGAPPDPFTEQGQLWGLPAPDPLEMVNDGYTAFGTLLAANMRHAGALRIDHAMGLQRLFLVPQGASAKDGAYLGYPFQDLLGVLALESQRARCLVVGEALGTVPEGMTEALSNASVLSYSVLWFERDTQGLRRPEDWRAQAAACVSTHDLPTLAGWWQHADIDERVALGLLGAASVADARAARDADKAALVELLAEAGLLHGGIDMAGPVTSDFVVAVHAFIAATPALLALVQADDLAGEVVAVNLPGTDRERPNWRRRLAVDVEAICRGDLAQRVFNAMKSSERVAQDVAVSEIDA